MNYSHKLTKICMEN